MTIWMPHADAGERSTEAAHGRVFFLDFRERAPPAATPDHYYGTGKTLQELTISGPLAVAVPGIPMGLAYAAAYYGRLSHGSLAPMLEPAIRYAEEGFDVTPKMARQLVAYYELLAGFPATARIFTTPDGPGPAGTQLRQPVRLHTM